MADLALVAGIIAAAISLPGVRDEGHLQAYAAGTACAVEAATCTGDWATLDFCQPVWRRSKRELAALLVDIAWFESGLIKRIAAGRCRPEECDAVKMPGGRILHRARGVYQIQYTGAVSATEWAEMVGVTDYSFFVASYAAARMLSAHERSCKSVSGAISGFATGGRCGWGGTPNRFAVYQHLLARVSVPPTEKPTSPVEPPAAVATSEAQKFP